MNCYWSWYPSTLSYLFLNLSHHSFPTWHICMSVWTLHCVLKFEVFYYNLMRWPCLKLEHFIWILVLRFFVEHKLIKYKHPTVTYKDSLSWVSEPTSTVVPQQLDREQILFRSCKHLQTVGIRSPRHRGSSYMNLVHSSKTLLYFDL